MPPPDPSPALQMNFAKKRIAAIETGAAASKAVQSRLFIL
jgi:hypothetical protein